MKLKKQKKKKIGIKNNEKKGTLTNKIKFHFIFILHSSWLLESLNVFFFSDRSKWEYGDKKPPTFDIVDYKALDIGYSRVSYHNWFLFFLIILQNLKH